MAREQQGDRQDGYRVILQGVVTLYVLALGVGIAWLMTSDFKISKAHAQSPRQPLTAGGAQSIWRGASFPVENFTGYTSPFGYRQHPHGGRRFHYGLDFAAPLGSYVRNWWEGKVMRVASDRQCGVHLILQSGPWHHVYCHLEGQVVLEKTGAWVLVDRPGGIEIRQGQSLRSGQRIGRVGMTGATTGPHLHWGLKYQGAWVDPALVIRAMTTSQANP